MSGYGPNREFFLTCLACELPLVLTVHESHHKLGIACVHCHWEIDFKLSHEDINRVSLQLVTACPEKKEL